MRCIVGLGIVAAFGFLFPSLPAAAQSPQAAPLFADDFRHGLDHWQMTDAGAWKIATADDGPCLSQYKNSQYKPPFRSPLNMALIKDVLVGDFTFTAQVQSTGRGNNHQDMCLFWGYQDPSHFYYVHLGKVADPHAHQIMIVNDGPRTAITKDRTQGTPWDTGWHQVKVVRRVADGTIEVYFDDMQKPALTANDKTFVWGQVGIGSFDDTGNWRDVKLCGTRVERPKP